MNRKLTGSLTDMHFAPTRTAKDNLIREAVQEESTFVTGNTVIDALLTTVSKDYQFADEMLANINYAEKTGYFSDNASSGEFR